MKKTVKLLSCFCYLLILASCTKDANLPIPETTPTVNTTLTGTVVDEANNPVDAATVTANGKTTSTNAQGFFTISNLTVSPNRAYVKVTKTGFFTGSKACIPAANSATQVKITLSSNTPNFTIASSSGGTASLANGSSVVLPANAVVTSGGAAYSGNIQLAVKHLDPSSSDFANLMPGDLQAVRTDGSNAALYSYGMLNVELTDDAGQALKLAAGKSATLTFPVPASFQGNAPSTIPLWYFDESEGIWKEEGSADLVGTNYVGQVSHFTTWNCDYPAIRTTIKGKVVDCNGTPLSGIWVLIDQYPVITNSEGIYTSFIPSDLAVEVSVPSSQNFGISGSPIAAGPYPAEQTTILSDLTVTCPASFTGTLIDCNNNPTPGIIVASWTGGSSTSTSSANGTFKIVVAPNQAVSIIGYTYDGFKSLPVNSTSTALGNVTSVGQISVCSITVALNTTFKITGGIYNNTDFMITQIGASSMYYTSADLTYISIGNQTNSRYFNCNFKGNTTGTFNPDPAINQYLSINLYNEGIVSDSAISNIPFTITKYESVGGVIEGTYQGTLYNQSNSTTYTITNGRFAITRGNDL
jgi:protocatechuate 3,4-dioxygenase beta subunit